MFISNREIQKLQKIIKNKNITENKNFKEKIIGG
jgi:hypothetical protein